MLSITQRDNRACMHCNLSYVGRPVDNWYVNVTISSSVLNVNHISSVMYPIAHVHDSLGYLICSHFSWMSNSFVIIIINLLYRPNGRCCYARNGRKYDMLGYRKLFELWRRCENTGKCILYKLSQYWYKLMLMTIHNRHLPPQLVPLTDSIPPTDAPPDIIIGLLQQLPYSSCYATSNYWN